MAKKIVRGITDVKTITNQDFDTNNVNDLLSDGQYNYIHRKKGKNEEYHNLTDNIKTISSDNTELLSVTNYNKTTNTALLSPKHDAQKEQLLESTRDTITINHGTNGTDEKTTVDTNPNKVLEHTNLKTSYGISKETSGDIITLGLEYTRVPESFDLNNLLNGCVRSGAFVNAPKEDTWFFVSAATENQHTIQRAIELLGKNNTQYVRLKRGDTWGAWREQLGDKSVIDGLLSQKQDTLVAGTGITIQGNTISATGGGVTSSIIQTNEFNAMIQVVESGDKTIKTFAFECFPETTEVVLTGQLKQELEHFVAPTITISNGALSITNDGTNIKLMNSKSTENVYQHATFTCFPPFTGGGGGDV